MPLQCSHSELEFRLKMLPQHRSAKHPEDSHPSHIPNHECVTVLRSPLVSSDAALITLPPAELLFPLAEFTDKSSSLLVVGSAVTVFELQSSVPERRTQNSVKTTGLPICRSTVSHRYYAQTHSHFCFPSSTETSLRISWFYHFSWFHLLTSVRLSELDLGDCHIISAIH